jgi:hypothetical protein
MDVSSKWNGVNVTSHTTLKSIHYNLGTHFRNLEDGGATLLRKMSRETAAKLSHCCPSSRSCPAFDL